MNNFKEKFYGHGKLLLTGEYYALDGALCLALPTCSGQRLEVSYKKSYSPKLSWISYGHNKEKWFEHSFEFWHFDSLTNNNSPEVQVIQSLLRQARIQNNHFLREEQDINVETFLEFPRQWGLGSSSTLVYNIAQWAHISPFELLFKTLGGSGFDIACAGSNGPILYEKKTVGPSYAPIQFDPSFKDCLYFVHLGKKINTKGAIEFYHQNEKEPAHNVAQISRLSKEFILAQDLKEFQLLMKEHELILARGLKLTPVKDQLFSDYWGEVKSLGAWGGDFVLVSSDRQTQETMKYFKQKGFDTIIPYCEMVLPTSREEFIGAKLTNQEIFTHLNLSQLAKVKSY